jgi:hypothetical protein
MRDNLFPLHLKIAIQRRRLEEMVAKHGKTSPLVIAQSQKLDQLIVQLQKKQCSF